MTDEAATHAAQRLAHELILQDERLTADLEDRDADILLRWALAAAERVVLAQAELDPSLDRVALIEAIRPVRQVARAINDLTAEHAEMDPHAFLERLLGLITAAGRLTPGAVPAGKAATAPPSTRIPPS